MPLLLDTNVILNALTGRGPTALKTLLANLPQSFVSAPVVAELSWSRGRLDPAHPNTAKVVGLLEQVLRQVDPTKILNPNAAQWHTAGERAGAVVRAIAGKIQAFKQPAERHEMLHDALTSLVASDAGVCVVTQDRDFDLFAQLDPNLHVLFYG
ncbi:MAG: PIN domain-containing protein [Sphingomonadaceae bacterium]|nr:PIN domain-containing protein [Sphingomonadaceae bacterium]